MAELTKLFCKDFYRAIWRIMEHKFCDEYWSDLWYYFRRSVEEDPDSFGLYVPYVYMYAERFFADKNVKKVADEIGLTDRISRFPREFSRDTSLDEFSNTIIELGEIAFELNSHCDPEYKDYFEAMYSLRWDSYRDMSFFGDEKSPTVLDVNWMEGHADSYTKLPYQALVEYDGREYEVCLAEDWPETIYIKTTCPYFKALPDDLINNRFHDLYDEMHMFYLGKFFRVSETERKSAMEDDYPLVLGGVINNINIYDGKTNEKLIKIVFFVLSNCIRRVDLTMFSNMKDIHDYNDDGMLNYGWTVEDGVGQFKKHLLDLVHKYRDQLYDGFIVEREHMAEDKGCPMNYFDYMPLGMF